MSNKITQKSQKSSLLKSKNSGFLKIERIIESFLEFYEKNHGKPVKFYKGWLILCPFHNDTNPSFAIYKDGTTWCFGCQKAYKLEAVLKAYGFWEGEIGEEPELRPDFTKLEAENWRVCDYRQYFYTDGEKTLIRVRFDLEDIQTRNRKKEFYFFQPTITKEGQQVLEPVKGYVPFILYRLPEIEDKEEVFYVEGEKCVDALWELGLPATTLPIGAKTKINRDLIKALLPLREKIVYILPDNDTEGWEYAKTINQALNTLGAKSQIIPIPRLWEKSDIADFVEIETLKGKAKEEIKAEILSWCKPKEKIVSFWEAMQKEQERGFNRFIVPGLFPAKGLGLLSGKSKFGKTEFLCLIVSKLLRGEPLFGRQTEKVKVLWITQEDTKESIGTRLMLRGITPQELQENIFTEEVGEEPTITGKLLIEEAKRLGCQMVILEPLLAIKELADLGIKDRLTYGAVYGVLLPLKKKAEEEGIFILGVHHANKGKSIFKDWSDVIDGVLGSTAFSGVPDCIIGIGLTSSGDPNLRRILAKGRGVMLDYLIEWVWEQKEDQGKPVLFGKYIEKGEYSPEFDLTPEQRRLVDTIKELGENATPKKIAQELGKTEGAVKMMLGELLDKRVIVKTKRGVYSISKKQNEPYFAYFPYFTYFSDFPYFAYFDTESKPKSDWLPYFQSLENSGLEAKVRKVSKVSLVENPTPTSTPTPEPTPDPDPEPEPTQPDQKDQPKPFWIVQIRGAFCPRCGDEYWKIGVNPNENRETVVEGFCVNCGHKRLVGLRYAKVVDIKAEESIPF
jgi:replicative DNA helicase